MSNNLYVPLDEVMKILTSMTIENKHDYNTVITLAKCKWEVAYIPTIDPIATIDEMIEENVNTLDFGKTNILQELKSRLSKK